MINKETGELHIIWGTDDVIEQAKDNIERGFGTYPVPTFEQALDILEIMEDAHDCNYGITWDSIDCALDLYFIDGENNNA